MQKFLSLLILFTIVSRCIGMQEDHSDIGIAIISMQSKTVEKKSAIKEVEQSISFLDYKLNKSTQFVDKSLDYTCIDMNAAALVQMSRNEKGKPKSIFTYGLGGCTSVGIYILLKNGQQYGILTHYDPTRKVDHSKQIQSLVKKALQEPKKIAKTVAIIMHPEGWKKNPETGFYDIMEASDPSLLKLLDLTIKASLNKSDIKKVTELY